MGDRLLDSLTPDEILPAVRELALADGSVQGWRILDKVAHKLDSSQLNLGDALRWDHGRISKRYQQRVMRALEKLAESGELVKDNRNRTDVTYYTPEKWQERLAEREAAEQRRQEKIALWDGIAERLGALGYLMTDQHLNSAQWLRLLDELEKARETGSE